MTYKEIEQAFKNDPVVLIPLGSMEEHGPQSPTGDYLAAEAIADRIAQLSGGFSVPVIPFGYSEYFRGFPGTISLSPDTILAVVQDICDCLIEHGITKIMIVNGHAGNAPIMEILARDIRRESGILVGRLDIWQSLSAQFKNEVYGQYPNCQGHGGEPVTSVMMYLYPDDMRMDLFDGYSLDLKWEELERASMAKVKILDSEATICFDMDEFTATGAAGDPSGANAELGERVFNQIVAYGVEFANKMKMSEMKLK